MIVPSMDLREVEDVESSLREEEAGTEIWSRLKNQYEGLERRVEDQNVDPGCGEVQMISSCSREIENYDSRETSTSKTLSL